MKTPPVPTTEPKFKRGDIVCLANPCWSEHHRPRIVLRGFRFRLKEGDTVTRYVYELLLGTRKYLCHEYVLEHF